VSAVIEVRFGAPCKALTMNDRMHWAPKGRMTAAWREAAFWATRSAACPVPIPLPPSVVTVRIPVRDRRRRDPHNWFPTVKAVIDGLVDAGWWPDDSSEWVTTTEPVLVPGGDAVIVHIEPRSPS